MQFAWSAALRASSWSYNSSHCEGGKKTTENETLGWNLTNIFDLLPIPLILRAQGSTAPSLFMQLILWSCRWVFRLAERITGATPSHWNKSFLPVLSAKIYSGLQTPGQLAEWQILNFKIVVMRSHWTRRFKFCHVYVCLVYMWKYSCVCLHMCL